MLLNIAASFPLAAIDWLWPWKQFVSWPLSLMRRNHELIVAAIEGDSERVRTLIALPGININARNHRQATALMEAAFKGHTDIVEILVNTGAQINSTAGSQESALTLAGEGNHSAIAKILLAHDAHVDHRNIHGYTALTRAVYLGHTEIVHMLLAADADIHIPINSDHTALDIAHIMGHTIIANMLQQVIDQEEDEYVLTTKPSPLSIADKK